MFPLKPDTALTFESVKHKPKSRNADFHWEGQWVAVKELWVSRNQSLENRAHNLYYEPQRREDVRTVSCLRKGIKTEEKSGEGGRRRES